MYKKSHIFNFCQKMSAPLLAALVLTGCPKWPDEAIEKQDCSIKGIISDVTTNASIPAVKVSIQSSGLALEETIVTGNDGVYRFDNLEPDDYSLTFIKEGYKSVEENISVTDAVKLDVAMERMPAEIVSDKDLLDFGEKISSLSFSIVNRSYWDLNWELVNISDNSWISSIVPSDGTLKYGKTETIVVSLDRDQLRDGENEAVLNIRSSGDGGVSIRVTAYRKPLELASVSIDSVYDIYPTSASFLAEITQCGFPEYDECGFVCGTTQQQTIKSADIVLKLPRSTDLTFSATATGLVLGSDYYVRSYVKNEAGVSYSDELCFQTKARLPEVSIISVTSLDLMNRTAVFNAEILYAGDPKYSERGFVYSCENTTPTLYDNALVSPGDSQNEFSAKANNLEVEKNYYVRSYARSEGGVSYSSSTEVFTTEQFYPSVMTLEHTELDASNHSVRFNGKVLDVGIPAYTRKGFVYSNLTSSPTIDDYVVWVEGAGDGLFTIVVKDLEDIAYYYRAVVQNNKGVVYGESKSFQF